MKYIYYAIAIMLFGCADNSSITKGLYSKWELTMIEEMSSEGQSTFLSYTEDWNCSIIVDFSYSDIMKINTCRNRLVGDYEIDKDKLEISEIGGTKVNEDKIGNKFLNLLKQSDQFVVGQNEETLKIIGSDFILTFKYIEI